VHPLSVATLMATQYFCITVGFHQSGHIKADSQFVWEVVLADQNVIQDTGFFYIFQGYLFSYLM
jgi:hypothetical protein